MSCRFIEQIVLGDSAFPKAFGTEWIKEFLALTNLIIAIQALFLCIHFILKSKGNQFLNKINAALAFCFALISLNTYVSLSSFIGYSYPLQEVANNALWFIGPSLYLYVSYRKKAHTLKSVIVHIFPYLIPTVLDVTITWPVYDNIIKFVAFTQIGIYTFLSLRFGIRNYQSERSFYSRVLPPLIIFALLVGINITLNLFRGLFNINLISQALQQGFTTLLAVPIFYISYMEMNATHAFGIIKKPYQSTPLSETRVQAYLETIQKVLIKEEVFRNKNLTLQLLSSKTAIAPKYISQIVNSELGLSFSAYITQLRLEAVCVSLLDANKKNLTIAGIAEECGFSSTSRFNHLFKDHFGITPSQYQKEMRNSQ